MRPPVLQVSGLTKRYGNAVALAEVDLAIEPGEILGLAGRNGAGKTTLISIVAGLLRPDAGRVVVCGADVVASGSAARSVTGLAPQFLGLYPTMTVRQNLMFFGRLSGLARAAAPARPVELGEALGLSGVLGRRAGTLSSGEQRRVHVACALVGRPRLLLLDEPTAGVDPQARALLLDVVRTVAATGTAVCYATHQLGEIEDLQASVAVLHRGRVAAHGTLASLIAAHARASVELTFEPGAPAAVGPGPVGDGDMLRIATDNPGATIAGVVGAMGAGAAALRSVEVIRPGLEAVFAAVTGEAFPEATLPDVPRPDRVAGAS